MAQFTITILASDAIEGINHRFTAHLCAGTRKVTDRSGDRAAMIGFFTNARAAASKAGHTLTVEDESCDFVTFEQEGQTVALKVATTPVVDGIDAAKYLHVALGGRLSALTGEPI